MNLKNILGAKVYISHKPTGIFTPFKIMFLVFCQSKKDVLKIYLKVTSHGHTRRIYNLKYVLSEFKAPNLILNSKLIPDHSLQNPQTVYYVLSSRS